MSAAPITFALEIPYKPGRHGAPALPVLSVTLAYDGFQMPAIIEAVVDSGADRTMFPYEFGEFLSVDWATCRKVVISTATIEGEGYECRVTLGVQYKRFEADVFFVKDAQQTLLGRADVFRQFLFAFDQRREVLLMAEY